MCLEYVDGKVMRRWGVGYKLVKRMENGSYTCFDHIMSANTVTYPINEWVEDPKMGMADKFDKPRYQTGFHISLNRKPLEGIGWTDSHRIIKVRFRKVVATNCTKGDTTYGYQVVARELMNLGELI